MPMIFLLILQLLFSVDCQAAYVDSDVSLESIVYSFLLISSSSCAQNALSDILPECIQNGLDSIDSSVRRDLAIRLSLCEFEVSGISFPMECTDVKTGDKCIDKLKLSPQYWTTYSGNYHHLQSICYQEALPYEKDKIIALFSKVTNLYKKLVEYMENVDSNFEDEIVSKLNIMLKEFQSSQTMFQEQLQHKMNEQFHSMRDNIDVINEYFEEVHAHTMGSVWSDLLNLKTEITEISSINKQVWGDDFNKLTESTIKSVYEISKQLEEIIVSSRDGIETVNSINQEQYTKLQENWLDIVQNQQEYLEYEFRDLLLIISEKIELEIFDSIRVIDDTLAESLQKLDEQIFNIQSKLETTDEMFTNFSRKLDHVLTFLIETSELVTLFNWDSLISKLCISNIGKKFAAYFVFGIFALCSIFILRFRDLYFTLVPLLLFGFGLFLGFKFYKGLLELAHSYMDI